MARATHQSHPGAGRCGPTGRPARLLLLAGVLLLNGCAAGSVNLWPFYFRETRLVQGPRGPQRVTQTDVLYPLLCAEKHPDGGWHAVRPLYNYRWSEADGTSQLQYLWPLGTHATEGDELLHHRFFPVFEYLKTRSPLTDRHTVHAHLLQIIRWGRDDRLGPYFAVFPLGGVTHGVLAETWSFLLFPLYSYYEHGSYKRRDVLWPVLSWGATPDGTRRVRRVWPFYVAKVREEPDHSAARHDVLWPIIRWGFVDKHGRYRHTVTVVTPFYSSIKTYDREGNLIGSMRGILGVFLGSAGEGGQQVDGWSALWSVVRSYRSPLKDEFRIFPLYWRTTLYRAKQEEPQWNRTRYWAPYPVVWVDFDRMDPTRHKGTVVVAGAYWQSTDTDFDGEGAPRKGRRRTLWPLVTVEKGAEGETHIYVASHGWKDTTNGFKRNYRAFIDLFQYHRRADGEAETRLLHRLYRHRRGPRGRYLSLAGLFTYDSTGEVVGEDGTYWSALFGLVKCSATGSGRRWRLLYVPLGGGPAEQPSTEVTDAPAS